MRLGVGWVTNDVFTNLNAAPVVIDGHYGVTNPHNDTNHGFFCLRKP